MKNICIFLICILHSFPIKAQNSKIINHRTDQSMLLVSPTVLLRTPNGRQLAGGIKYQVFLGKRFSIDADIVFSKDYFHFSPSVIGVPLGLLGLSSIGEDSPLGTGLLSLAAILLSLEHVSYNIPVTNSLDISPYVGLLRYKYAYNTEKNLYPDFISEQFSFATGIQLNKYFGRFVFSPYGEYNIGYNDRIPGYNIGIYSGIYFFGKDK